MARSSVLDGFRSVLQSRHGKARLREWLAVGSALALSAGWAADARASGLFRGLTAQDRSRPVVLSQTGEVISLRSPGHPAAGLASGAVPAYLAFPLAGGERIPAQTPTIATGMQPGPNADGPLALTPAVQAPLNADLRASRGAIVQAPSGSYAVAMLPRYARALAQAAPTAPTTTGPSGATSLTSMLGLNPQANWMVNGIPSSKLTQWFNTGTKEISHLTSLGVDGVSKTLGLKIAPTTGGYTVAAAQELIPPMAAETTAVATPEPGAWLVFGLMLGAAGLRRRLAKGSGAENGIAESE